jgi:predicted esterase
LRSKKFSLERIFLVGASIGANLAIKYLAEHHETGKAIALSPGYDYKGIQVLSLMSHTDKRQGFYLVAAKDDSRVPDSWKAVEDLAKTGQAQKQIKIFETGGHGTEILTSHPEFMDILAGWLSARA